MEGYIEKDRYHEAGAEMTERGWVGIGKDRRRGERLIQTSTSCSMYRCHSAGKRGSVKTRKENEKNR